VESDPVMLNLHGVLGCFSARLIHRSTRPGTGNTRDRHTIGDESDFRKGEVYQKGATWKQRSIATTRLGEL
jgi:hypothetical protein